VLCCVAFCFFSFEEVLTVDSPEAFAFVFRLSGVVKFRVEENHIVLCGAANEVTETSFLM